MAELKAENEKVECEAYEGSADSKRTYQTMLDKRAGLAQTLRENEEALESLKLRILTQQQEVKALDLAIEQFKAISHLL